MLKLIQEMKLTQKLDFRMIQSLKLLPMTIMQLEQRMNEELEMNPMLQMDETIQQEQDKSELSGNETGKVETDSQKEEQKNDFTEAEWTKYMEDGFNNRYNFRQESDPNYEEREPVQTYVVTLSDYLLEQLGITVTNDDDRKIGEYIIGSINEDGFLELSDEEIANSLHVPVDQVTKIVELIQQFEPTGIAARDLRESLLIQLRDRGRENSIEWQVINEHYDEFANRKLNDILRAMSISEKQLKEAIEVIGMLTPRPGAIFDDTQNTAIVPDIIVEEIEGEYVLMHNDWHTPRLTINSSYRKLLNRNSGTSPETRKYLVEKLNSARWFINSIEQRRSTIMKVASAIVERQMEFLERGISYLKPMTLQDIADSIGIAISTVQRVTTGKYIQTPQGIFELKYFFTQRISSSNGSNDFSAKSVKEKMKEIISEENTKKPLSDQKIAHILYEKGISISRRAIAKYRDELQIPPARLRKQL
ncbi:MAG TPA: RNA polymerase sigma-54 factor [bacterium]|nr:RNA polymerase sigma-54 factor [bacterium]